ncbi:DNA polymerase III subunit gamma/tau [Edaphobacter albus]|uniref:DNA polymerase III subunit gamma/tau n=1 Tax=Edaphobacter sp. 4G125 TaxID=2763071 RepID=UPI001649146F|nr:DNA polymerase III subunit gamma/tau [Edaphobacter sp. 4G125]QNI35299.1 DNA polymerase III subunit gamma/tau [Edaphobacter sp. 4G125]
MAYQVLARKYRPQRFADVAGQDHVTVTLMNALTQGRIAHGYIFSGHRGIGKTTIARILAMALNCRNAIGSPERPTAEPCEVCESCVEIRAGNAVDVIEIDAATNRGIDEIRELRDAARYRPARDRYKIYILDEAHQITDAAFNALLKTLEEPPDHIVFMMATTQPEDIPQTVRSRCQHFSFHAVKLVDILAQLRGIAEKEGVVADEAALALLAEAGDGSMRDALSIMDQAIASAPLEDGRPRLDVLQIRDLMGTVPNAVFERVLEGVNGNRSAEVITVANELLDAGNSPAQLARQFVRYLRNCLIAKIAGLEPDNGSTELLQISSDEQRRAARSAALFSEEELTRFLQVMLRTFDELGYRQEQRFHFELGLMKLVHLQRLLPVEELLSKFPTSGGPGSGGGAERLRQPTPPATRPTPQPVSTPVATAPSKPAFSPFAADNSKKTTSEPISTPPRAIAPTETLLQPHLPPAPAPAVSIMEADPIAEITAVEVAADLLSKKPSPAAALEPEGAPSAKVNSQTQSSGSAEDLQRCSIEALSGAKSQGSAADALGDAEWMIAGDELRVQTELSKTMLPMVINTDADRIVRAALRGAGAGHLKLVLLPGTANTSAAKKPKPVKSGSVQAKAMEHPVVQQAQRLFNAEIRNVIDLRDND